MRQQNQRHFSLLNRMRGTGGFSVVELSVTLVIIGVALAATIPSFSSSLTAHRLDGSADALSSDLRLVRAKAVAENVPHILAWYSSVGWYYTVRDENRNGQPDWYSEPYVGPFQLPDGVQMKNSPSDPFSTNWLVFFPDGSTNVGGSLVFENKKGRKLQISILQPSGAVNVSKVETTEQASAS